MSIILSGYCAVTQKKCQHPKLINFFDYYNGIRVNKYRQNSTSTFSQLRPSWEDNRFFTRERAKLSAAASTIFEASYKEKTFTLLTVNVYATTGVLDPVAGGGSASNDAAACRIYYRCQVPGQCACLTRCLWDILLLLPLTLLVFIRIIHYTHTHTSNLQYIASCSSKPQGIV